MGPDSNSCLTFAFSDKFQSTGPLRDPTILSGWNPRTAMGFQSTGPLRDPTRGFLPRRERFSISIHRSLAGPDRRCQLCRFALVISIHRSLAGPDRSQCIPFSHLSGFQSTGPLRDPTQISQSPLQTMLYFNPQVPCGTRPSLGGFSCCLNVFQSTGPLRDPTGSNQNLGG